MDFLRLSFFVLVALTLASVPGAAQNPSASNKPNVPPPSAATDSTPDDTNPYTGLVPNRYLKEADEFLLYCKSNATMNQYYDCSCLSLAYLDKRMSMGDEAMRREIMTTIEGKCRDATNAAGEEYLNCIGSVPLLPQDQDPEKYCQCYARTYATLYEKTGAPPTSKDFVELQTQAHVTCSNRELAKRLYPYVVPPGEKPGKNAPVTLPKPTLPGQP